MAISKSGNVLLLSSAAQAITDILQHSSEVAKLILVVRYRELSFDSIFVHFQAEVTLYG